LILRSGHEDLRQDKRVMQLFGLINTLLANDNDTAKKDLKIRGYSVIPLSPNSGLIEVRAARNTYPALSRGCLLALCVQCLLAAFEKFRRSRPLLCVGSCAHSGCRTATRCTR
jgi:hypothetical protein